MNFAFSALPRLLKDINAKAAVSQPEPTIVEVPIPETLNLHAEVFNTPTEPSAAPTPNTGKPLADRGYKRFLEAWNETSFRLSTIPADWANGTGYYDEAEHVNFGVAHPAGTMIAGFDEKTARRLLIVVTTVGNVVLFERFSNGDKGVLVFNMPTCISRVGNFSGALNEYQINTLLGQFATDTNIGKMLLDLNVEQSRRARQLASFDQADHLVQSA